MVDGSKTLDECTIAELVETIGGRCVGVVVGFAVLDDGGALDQTLYSMGPLVIRTGLATMIATRNQMHLTRNSIEGDSVDHGRDD
jgi:hypothetical protein